MNIDPRATIAGIPIIKVRDTLRKLPGEFVNIHYLVQLGKEKAAMLANELVALGYIEEHEKGRNWKLTREGCRFVCASAAPPITRETASRKIQELLDRIKTLNADDNFAFKVTELGVFGSYLSAKSKLSDIDLTIDLQYKEDNVEKRRCRLEDIREKAEAQGTVFRSLNDRLEYPRLVCMRFLRGGARAYSFHYPHDAASLGIHVRILFKEGASNDLRSVLRSGREAFPRP